MNKLVTKKKAIIISIILLITIGTLEMEIKYPNFLKPNWISKNSSVYLLNEEGTVTLTIKQKENESIEEIINIMKDSFEIENQ